MQFEAVKNEAGLNRFVMLSTKWITQMNAIGITSKAGLEENRKSLFSKIINQTLETGFIKLFDENAADKMKRYIPYWV